MGKEKKGKNIGFDIGKRTRTIRFIAVVMAMTFVFIHFGSSVIDVSRDSRWKEGIFHGEENSEEAVEDTAEKADGDHIDHEHSESGAYDSDSDNKYASEFQRESAEREQEAREKTIESQKEELVQDKGLYSEDSIVLENTSKEEAERIAEKLGAKVRTTAAGDFAVLYLPEGMTIEDVYNNDELAVEVTKMSPDYYISADSITDNSAALSSISILKDINDEDETEGESQEEPYIPHAKVLKTRPNYQADDSYYGSQQYLDYLNIQDTWTKTKGSGIRVAIIDSGIDTDHPEFAGRISEMSYYASQDKVVKDYDMSIIEDEQGHGTAVAGVLAASIDNAEGIAGIAPEVELVIIKCDVDSSGEFVRGSDAVLGLAYAIEQDVDIINMSFGSYGDIFSKYTKLAVDSDIICIASAGNDGSSVPVYPASLDSVIAVGAYDTDNDMLCDYSNYGENVDILAPGTAYTTQINGEYGLSTGTSISAPIAVGAAALYMSLNGKVEFNTMLELFRASSVDIGILGEDYRNGYGELDINALACEEKGTITYDMLTDEVPNQTQIFVKGHTVQSMPEPERLYVVYDGWFFDPNCTDECELYTNIFQNDVTLYASWINEDEGSVFSYTTKADGTIDIRSYTGKRRYITVPSVIEGKQVTSIGERAFADNQRLRTVMLPESLRVIDDWAFTNCTMLRTVVVPDSVTYIGQESFSGCSRLSLVDIANTSKLASIGERAFAFTGINEFYIPSGMNSLGGYAFYGSTGLRSVSIAGGNTTYQIISNAIYNVSGDTLIYYPAGLSGEYTIPEGTVNIGDAAFAYTRSTMVQLNDGLKSIGKEGFAYGRVGSASFPESLEVMGAYVYSNSNRLSSVTFSENGSLTKIADYAFNGTCSLKSIVIPQYIIELGDCSFSGSGLTEAIFEENSTLSLIGMSAFSCTQIKEVDIPDSVLVISGCAFSSCWELTSVSFGQNSNCQSILYSAFSYDERLKNIILPDSLKILGENAFYNSGLTSITIGSGLTELGYGVFASCKNLSEISVSSDNPNYTSYDGVLYNKDKSSLLLFPAGRAGEYSLPATVIRIERYGFSGANKLTIVNLNEGLTEIGEFAFENCKALQIPMFPSTLTEIESYAFMLCEGMTGTLLIPKKTKHIGYFAFFYDYNITDIDFEPESEMDRFGYGAFGYCGIEDFTIPRNISTMGQEVFVGCNKLLAVTFESESKLEYLPARSFSGADNLRRITFESDSEMTHIEARACESLTQLEMVDLSGCNKLKDIDNYAFRMCVSLTGMDLPEIIENIGRYAFYGCSSMSEIRLPETVNHIGRYAFSKTNSINLYFASAVLPENLEENWDSGIGAYYVGVDKVQENDDWFYAVTPDGKASVIKYKGASSEVVLDNIDGHEVVSIGGEAFIDNTSVTSVTLPTSLTGIYKAAFKGTIALKSIVIPANVKVIGSEAFSGSGIESVTFETGSKLTSIESMAFEGTNNLTGIVIPNGVTQIKEKTFYGSGIKSITIPDNVNEIGRLSFAESGLEFVAIPASVTDISYYAFKNTKALTDVNFASTEAKETLAVTNSIAGKLMIRDEVFYGSGLLSVNVPKYVNYIGNLVFSNCKNLTEISVDDENLVCASLDGVLYDKTMSKLITCPAGKTGSYTLASNVANFALGAFEGSQLSEITIPEESSLITIGHRAFYGCKNLTSINIPDSVQSVEYYAFAYCDNLETVSINPTSQLGGIYEGAFYNCAKLSSIVIPDTVLEISDYAFYGCSSLEGVIISENSHLQGIFDHAFEATGIVNFSMPAEMIELGSYAFSNSKLDTFVFNEGLNYIGDYALANLSNIKTKALVFPRELKEIGYGCLYKSDCFEELTLPFLGKDLFDLNPSLKYLYGSTYDWVNVPKNIKRVTILNGTIIGEWGFESFPVEEIILPSTISIIKQGVFAGCRIKNISLPEGIIEIPNYAFAECKKLESINLPKSCKRIEASAFRDCIDLKRINITERVSYISNDNVFTGCVSLEQIMLSAKNTSFEMVDEILFSKNKRHIIKAPVTISGVYTVPEGVEEIGDGAFSDCTELQRVVFGNTVKTIGNAAFSNCGELQEIEWGNSVNIIGEEAFEGTGIIDINMVDSIENVGNRAFLGCRKLKNVRISDGLTKLSWDMFNSCIELENVIISENTSVIGVQCFENCQKLRNISIPKSVQVIEREAFENCYRLENIYIGENVSEIQEGVFTQCTSLNKIEVSENNINFSSVDGILYNYDKTSLIMIPSAVSGIINVPEGVTKIMAGSFSSNKKITGIILPDSVEEIGDFAFSGCTSLANVKFGHRIKCIGDSILSETTYSFDPQNWFDGVLYYDKYALEYSDHIFYSDSSGRFIREFGYGKDVRIKEGTTLIAKNTFNGAGIKSIYLPDSVKYINDNAFFVQNSLKFVKGGRGIEKVGEDAFRSTGITSFQLGDNYDNEKITSFSNCNLEYIKTNSDDINNIYCQSNNLITYVGAYNWNCLGCIPKNLILENEQQINNSELHYNFNVFTRVKEADKLLSDCQGEVYYDGEWNLASFYVDGVIVSMLPIKANEIVKVPPINIIKNYLPEGADFLGWDINGDGKIDDIPFTLIEDLEANAVFTSHIKKVIFENVRNENILTDDDGMAICDEFGNYLYEKKWIAVSVGESYDIKYICQPVANNQNEILQWNSSDESCLTVDQNGRLTAIAYPETEYVTVRASLQDNQNVFEEICVYIYPKNYGISLLESSTNLNVGDLYKLDICVFVPDEYQYEVTFESSDNGIATVDSKGMITAVGSGVTDIYIKCGPNYSTSFSVTVNQPLTGVLLSETEGTVNVGETITLNPTFKPANTTDDKSVFWYSKDSSIAKVNSAGVITGIAPGKAEIVGVVGQFKVTYTVTVKAPIERITLNTTKGTLRLDKTKQLDVIFIPSNTTDDRSVVWSSADPEIASVDENGLVTGIKNGKTVITGTVGSGTENEHSATYTVSVIGLRDEATGITVTNSDDTEMEDGTSLVVDELNEDEADEIYNEYGNSGSLYGGIKLLIKDKHGRVYFLYIYDISLFINNTCIQPGTEVDVDIPFPKGLIKNNSHVYRVEIDGGLTELDVEVHSGFFRFKTDHFSVYALAVPTDTYEAADIELDTDELTLCIGEMHTVSATVLPEEAEDKSLTYTSADESVATVDVDGNITGISEGTTTITVSSVVEGVEKTIEVKVSDHDWDEGVITKDVTCIEDGEKTFTCQREGCGKTRTEVIKAHGHEPITDEAVSATCTETGLTEGSHCSVCGEILVAQTEVPALGHRYGNPTWTWDGTKSAEAEFICEHNQAHIETVKATITNEVTIEANCSKDGEILYTATVEFESKTYTDTKSEVLKATGHTYKDPVWIWNAAGGAKASFVCINDDSTEEITATVTSEVTTKAACETAGVKTYTATVTFKDKTYRDTKTETIDPIGHKYSEPTWTWDGTEKAEAKFVCENDKEHIKTIEAVITDEVITAPTCETEGETKYTATVTFEGNVYVDVKNEKTTATGHKFGKPEWTWDGVNGATAKFTCSNDESHSQTLVAAITDETIVAATYDSEGEKKYTASVEFEGVTYTDEKLESIAALVYDYDAPEWIWDETKSAKAKFVRDDGFTTVIDAEIVSEITTDETCEAYGEKTYTATVTFEGKTYTDEKVERIDPLGHKYGKPVWTWNGTETAEAKFICENDSEHTEVLQAIITDEVTVEPAYDTKGERTYTATVTFNGETYTSIKTEEIEALTKPEIVSDPSDLRTIRGSKGRFTVKATGDNLTYQWQVSKDGKTWVNSSSEGNTADTIAIIATKSLNGRMYRCMVTDGISVLYSKPATFTTIEVVSLNPKNTTATEGNTVKLTIKSRSSVAKLQWQVSKDGGKTWVNSGSAGNKTATLSFAAKTSYNRWKYRCKVTNGTWVEYSSAALLTVNPKVNIITQPKNVSTYYGNIAKFTVKAEGDNLKYQWQVSKDGTKWTNSSAAGNKTETLRFTATSTLNGRYFRCKVTGGGKTVYTVAVKLTSKKNIITQPKAVSVKAGAKASFTIKAGGNSLKYQWQVSKDGGKTWTNSKSAGYNTAALSITAKAGYSGWMFRCIVTNGTVKTVLNAAKLTVK